MNYQDGTKTIIYGGLLTKIFTLVSFSILARILSYEQFTFIPLLQALAMLCYSVLSLGIPTFLERHYHSKLKMDSTGAKNLLFTSYVIILASTSIGIGIFSLFSNVIYTQYSENFTGMRDLVYFSGGILLYFINFLNCFYLILLGEIKSYTFLLNTSDILSKTTALILFLYDSTTSSLLIGLAIGYIPTVLYGTRLSYKLFLGEGGLEGVWRLLGDSYSYYIESIINCMRNYGDSLLLAALVGSEALTIYTVAKKLSDQLSLIINPFQTTLIPILGKLKSEGQHKLQSSYSEMWNMTYPSLLLLGALASGASYFFIYLISGTTYIDYWRVGFVLCFCKVFLVVLSIETRFLFLMGGRFSRLIVTSFQFILFVAMTILASRIYGSLGVAISLFVSLAASIALAKLINGRLQFVAKIDLKSLLFILAAVIFSFYQNYFQQIGQTPLNAISIFVVCFLMLFVVYAKFFENKHMVYLINMLPRRVSMLIMRYI